MDWKRDTDTLIILIDPWLPLWRTAINPRFSRKGIIFFAVTLQEFLAHTATSTVVRLIISDLGSFHWDLVDLLYEAG